MTAWRSNTRSSTAVKWPCSYWPGFGVPASEIPATGTNGAAILYNDIAETGGVGTDEYSMELLTLPISGTLTTYENSSFIFTDAPDGTYTATYRGKKNGAEYGVYTATFIVGGQELTMTLDGGTFSYSGADLQLSRQYALQLDGGAFAYAGADLAIAKQSALQLDGGAFSYSGADMDMIYIPSTGATYVFPLSGGVFTYSGGSINFARNLSLQLSGGSFNYYGATMALNYSGAVTVAIGAYTISFMPSHTAKYEV